jgi:hypothetical protein
VLFVSACVLAALCLKLVELLAQQQQQAAEMLIRIDQMRPNKLLELVRTSSLQSKALRRGFARVGYKRGAVRV